MIIRRFVLGKGKRKRKKNKGKEDNYKNKVKKKTKGDIIKELIEAGHISLKSLHRMKKETLENVSNRWKESGCSVFSVCAPTLNIQTDHVLYIYFT